MASSRPFKTRRLKTCVVNYKLERGEYWCRLSEPIMTLSWIIKIDYQGHYNMLIAIADGKFVMLKDKNISADLVT